MENKGNDTTDIVKRIYKNWDKKWKKEEMKLDNGHILIFSGVK